MPQQHRVVVVTGAGSGLGAAMAVRLLADGHAVVLAGRREDALQETARLAEREGAGGAALVVPTDVTDETGVQALVAAAVQRFGRLDVMVTNAGTMQHGGAVDEVSPQDWRSTVEVNLTGTFLCVAAAFRQMRSQHPSGGRIITNGSVSAHVPRPRSAAYTATKHAVTGLTRSVELDGREHRIRCTQLDVGNAATELIAAVGSGALQADGSVRPEPTFDPRHVADLTAHLVGLPLEVSVPFVTMTAGGMPWVGRG